MLCILSGYGSNHHPQATVPSALQRLYRPLLRYVLQGELVPVKISRTPSAAAQPNVTNFKLQKQVRTHGSVYNIESNQACNY
jgi:hypothetical protein